MNKKIFILVLIFISNFSFSQSISTIICKLDFGNYFIIEEGYIIEEYKGDLEKLNRINTIYHYRKNNEDLFLYLVKEDTDFKLFFSGDFSYLKYRDFSVTNAKDFILYDKKNKKLLLLISGNIGLFSNRNGKIKISNNVNCFGSSITLLDNKLNEISSIRAKFELPCSNTFGFNETNDRSNEYDKELITINGETILLKGYLEPLFQLNISDIYGLLQIKSN